VAAKAKPKIQAKGSFFTVVGSDEGLVREKALELYNRLTGGLDDGFTHETIDGVADNAESAHEICSSTVQALLTIPMFGGDKVVWLRNANFFADSVTGRAQRTEAGVENLRATLERGLPDGVKFLLTAQSVDKRRGFWKFVEKAADVQVHDRIDTSREGWEEQVGALVSRRAKELGLRFERDAMALFVLLAGEATQQIGNELEKLDLYLGPERREVTEEDVRQMVPLSRAALVFEIGKSIQSGDTARVLELIDQQLEADESAIGIMRASIIPTVRNLFMAKLIVENLRVSGGSYQSFAGGLNRLPEADRAWLPQKKDGTGVNVFPIFLAVSGAAHFELAGLQHAMEAALRADQALVTTGLDHRLVLHRLIAEIAAGRKPDKRRATPARR
jgi:DNA polymerase III subunit delta